MAWVCEAEIRTERNYLRMIREAKTLEDLQAMVHMNDFNIDCNVDMMNEIMKKHAVEDPAFDAAVNNQEPAAEETTVSLCAGKQAVVDTGKNKTKAVLG